MYCIYIAAIDSFRFEYERNKILFFDIIGVNSCWVHITYGYNIYEYTSYIYMTTIDSFRFEYERNIILFFDIIGVPFMLGAYHICV